MSNEPQKSTASGSETYDGTCHCGTVQYSVTLSPPLAQQEVRSCNCTICTRNGYLFVYPAREQIDFESGAQSLGEYTFGQKKNVHKFCKRCGSSLYTDPRMKEFGEGPPDLDLDLLAVNVRMFKNVDLKDLNIVKIDGRKEMPFVGEEISHLQQ